MGAFDDLIPAGTARQRTDPSFPRVSPSEQADRDSMAAQLVASELENSTDPEQQAILTKEYRLRFGEEPPTQAGAANRESAGQAAGKRSGVFDDLIPSQGKGNPAGPFADLVKSDEPQKPSVLRNVLLNNPLTAAGETVLNLATQGVALPVAGWAGLATEAGRALGLTEKTGADVVHAVGEALTYQPRGELGQAATGAVMTPFEKLQEAGQAAGGKVLDATGSPAAATAVDSAINMLPMAISPAVKGMKAAKAKISEAMKPKDTATAAGDVPRGFVPLEAEATMAEAAGTVPAIRERSGNVAPVETRAERLAGNDPAVHGPEAQGFPEVRRSGDNSLPAVDGELQAVPGRHGAGAEPDALAGAAQHEGELRAQQLPVDDAQAAAAPARVVAESDAAGQNGPGGRSGGNARAADQEFGVAPGGERVRSGQASGGAEALPELEAAGIQRRDAAAPGNGQEVRRADREAAGSGEGRLALGDGAEPGTAAKPETIADPLKARIDEAAHEAATSPLNDKPHPTPAQIEAGTYAKGHVRVGGLDISIENPKGSIRSGVSPEGKAWKTTMQDHYGYVKRTTGKDGDPVDMFIGDKPSSERVFVVDQVDPKTGRFDEHKAILGAETLDEAKAIYHRNYEPGWRGAGGVKEMTLPEFKEWIRAGNTRKPLTIRSVAGKPVTEIRDSLLAKMAADKGPLATSGATRAAIDSEIARRAAYAAEDAGGVRNAFVPGSEYVGFVQDTPSTATPASTAGRGKPIRREDILIDFAKALGTSIYEGRVKGKNRLGFFRPKLQETRIKRHADLETAAHELAHLIDDRVPEISQAWKKDRALETELRSISYDASKVYEGFAEGVRLWMTQPDALQAKAPRVHAWLEQFADSHQYGPAMRKAQAGMTEWFGQDAIDRARSKIGDHRPLSDALDGIFDRFRQSVTDDLHGIYRMERDLKGGKVAPVGAYESARLSRASASIADGAVRHGHPVKKADGSFTFAGKGLEEILKPIGERLDDFLLYAVGRSAGELMAQGREHLFTAGEIRAMQALETPEFKQAFAEYQAWNKGVLDFAEAQGVINPEARRLWQRTQYLPFHRVGQPGGVKGKPGDWAGIQALTGGTENIRDVLGNMVGNAAMLIDKAVKNEARAKVADLADSQGGGKFMARIDPEARPVKISGDQVLQAMFEKYGIALDGEAPAFFEFLIHGQPPAGANVVAVLKGGKPVWYEVADPILYRALQAIDRPNQHWLTKWLGMPKRVGQATITLTPDFMLANIARDTIMGGVMSRSGFRPFVDSVNGMRLRLMNDPLHKDYIANGGGLSSIYLDDGKLRHKLEKFYSRQGIDYRTVLDAPDKLLSFVETLGDAFETSTRLGEYKRAIERGEHPRHAAYQGREVSTDFAMRGDSKALGFMYDTVMFLRPAVVSMDRLFRGVAHDPNKAAIGLKTGMLALSSIALYLKNRDDPRYQDLPDWDRDAHWHFFAAGEHFRYPKIWEIGAVSSAAERTVEKLMESDPGGLGKDFARIVGHVFNLNLMPQIIAPLYEQATNRNSFTGAPIETPGMENMQMFMRAKPTTSETMKAAGMATRNLPEKLQLNPVRAEMLLRGYFNTFALYGLALSDKAFFGDKLPETRTDQLPVIRRFYSEEPPQHTKYETMFYDMLGEAKRLQGTLRELDRIGRPDIADEKETSPLAGEAKPLERAAKNLQHLNAEMRQVRRDDSLTPKEKREKLDALTVERNALLKAAVQDAQAAQKIKTEEAKQ